MKKNKAVKPTRPVVLPEKLPITLDALRELGPDRLLLVTGGGVATSPSAWPPIT